MALSGGVAIDFFKMRVHIHVFNQPIAKNSFGDVLTQDGVTSVPLFAHVSQASAGTVCGGSSQAGNFIQGTPLTIPHQIEN